MTTRKLKDYQIIVCRAGFGSSSDTQTKTLAIQVREQFDKGWHCEGGAFVLGGQLLQTMVLVEVKEVPYVPPYERLRINRNLLSEAALRFVEDERIVFIYELEDYTFESTPTAIRKELMRLLRSAQKAHAATKRKESK